MQLSVMVCTRNSRMLLDGTLEALSQCAVPADVEWELVVVDNGSSDGTLATLSSWAHRLPLVPVSEPVEGLSRARNAGLDACRGDLVVFTDDDVRPAKGWLGAYWTAFLETEGAAFLGGPIVSEFESPDPAPELLRWSPPSVRGLDYGPLQRPLGEGEWFIGPNWACPAAALAKVGRFDTRLGLGARRNRQAVGEETDLMRRLSAAGIRGVYVPGARVHHFVSSAKTTLAHVGARAEAIGYREGFEAAPRDSSWSVGGVPRWMLRRLLATSARLCLARVAGRPAYGETIALQLVLGQIRGAREACKARGAP